MGKSWRSAYERKHGISYSSVENASIEKKLREKERLEALRREIDERSKTNFGDSTLEEDAYIYKSLCKSFCIATDQELFRYKICKAVSSRSNEECFVVIEVCPEHSVIGELPCYVRKVLDLFENDYIGKYSIDERMAMARELVELYDAKTGTFKDLVAVYKVLMKV